MQATLARLSETLKALGEAKLEISGIKLTAAVGIGYGLSRCVLGHTSPTDVAVDVMATVGTYVISEAAIKLGQGIRSQFISNDTTNTSTLSTSSAKIKVK
ncbi:hypothetical protein [Candidatus Berkiella aquae]|uniref:Type-F conjugative transfer system protein TrbI n=1 Tax=Candidatus Berkiella aquae TaxID=295108 RepID=A0A0Q9YVF8_9GAMM|nr:hypothetical protein [Candidatus Berkiella aquae]MCS5710608.1 type-F conjugative transfer system protein TrbI [Candidatus Berkiella aquae]